LTKFWNISGTFLKITPEFHSGDLADDGRKINGVIFQIHIPVSAIVSAQILHF
jgi:hypothetical protein